MATQMLPATNIKSKIKTTLSTIQHSHCQLSQYPLSTCQLTCLTCHPFPAMQAQLPSLTTQCIVPATTNLTVSSSAVDNLLMTSLVNSSHHLPTISIYTYLQILTTQVHAAPSQLPTTITHPTAKRVTDNYYQPPSVITNEHSHITAADNRNSHFPFTYSSCTAQQLLMLQHQQFTQSLPTSNHHHPTNSYPPMALYKIERFRHFALPL